MNTAARNRFVDMFHFIDGIDDHNWMPSLRLITGGIIPLPKLARSRAALGVSELSDLGDQDIRKASEIPFRKALPALVRDPLGALVSFGNAADGTVVRLNLGAFRPYLVTDPRHVQHVLRDNADNYVRDGQGMLWGSVKRLFGEGIMSEGRVWQASRKTLQPLFTARRVDALVDVMADEISRAADDLPTGPTLDIGAELARVVCRTVMRALFA